MKDKLLIKCDEILALIERRKQNTIRCGGCNKRIAMDVFINCHRDYICPALKEETK